MQTMSNLPVLVGKYRFNIQDIYEKTGLVRRTVSVLYNSNVIKIDFFAIGILCRLFYLFNNETQKLRMAVGSGSL